MAIATPSPVPFGPRLKEWRNRRRLSQLDFALEAEISQRHLSFIETGRSRPSRDMVVHLSTCLDVPLRERNALLLAAGYAPLYRARDLDDPSLAPARAAIDTILKGHEPFPAIAVDRHWSLVAANDAVPPLLAGVADPGLLEPPVNVLRLSLHPDGLAPRILNLAEWRDHVLGRLRQQFDVSADPALGTLMAELKALPGPEPDAPGSEAPAHADIVVPLRLASPAGTLSLFSTTTVFGTPVDVTLSEIAIESFFPTDEATRRLLLG